MPSNETPLDSCKAIVYFLEKVQGRLAPRKRRALLQDLVWKLRQLPESSRHWAVAAGLREIARQDLGWLGREHDLLAKIDESVERPLRGTGKRHFDVGIVTVIEPELEAILVALGRRRTDREDLSVGPQRYWYARTPGSNGSILTVVLTNVGRPRNVPCAIATDRLLESFSVGILLLVGIAAGLKEKVALCDVVGAERIIDYEHVRQELPLIAQDRGQARVDRIRPLHIEVYPSLRGDLERFVPSELDFVGRFERSLAGLRGDSVPKSGKRVNPQFHKGTIVAGEKLIADGSLVDKRLLFDERLRAADQEDSGFAQACDLREPRIPWLVFRGIADFGNPKKSPRYQHGAALAASVASLLFLAGTYRAPIRA